MKNKIIKAINNVFLMKKIPSDYYRLKNNCKKDKGNLKLHFGCGPRILKGWINIDLSYEPNYQNYNYGQIYYPSKIRGKRDDLYLFNILEVGLPLPDDCVDVVFHEDFIEHLDQKEQFLFLAETLRVMKKGAIHRVNTPNLLPSLEKGSEFSKGLNGVNTGEWSRWGHKNVLTPAMLKEMATIVGYSRIIFSKRDRSLSKLIPLEYRPASDRLRKGGNIFADLIK
jgi:hypothetical protein